MVALLRFILVIALVVSALGHAQLTVPAPLNNNPTKTTPCGVTTLPATPVAAAQWAVGTKQSMTWKLIATDGGVSVSGAFDTTAAGKTAAAFTVPAWTANSIATGNGVGKTYPLAFTVPADLKCTGPNGLCLMRMFSNTGWNSCIYVNVTQNVEPVAPTPAPKCQTATGLTFCTAQNGQGVLIGSAFTLTELDAEVSAAYTAGITNPGVFSAGNSSACAVDYKTYMCATNFPPCAGAPASDILTPCNSMCTNMTTTCELTTDEHALYDCTDLPQCPSQLAAGGEGGASGASQVAAASALFALLAFASVLL